MKGLEPRAGTAPQVSPSMDVDEAADEDDEAVVKPTQQAGRTMVMYDVSYSPTYLTPVLYLTIKQPLDRPPMSLDKVYGMLVPALQREQLRSIGPMGSLSMTEHPVTGLPAYFVHPCKTQEAMAAISGGRQLEPLEYLIMWLGIVGPSVGLSLPVELAAAMSLQDDATR